jgi:hypothetical protein
MRLIEVHAINRSLFLLFANIIVASYVLGLSAEHECIIYVFFGSGDGLDLIVAQAMHSWSKRLLLISWESTLHSNASAVTLAGAGPIVAFNKIILGVNLRFHSIFLQVCGYSGDINLKLVDGVLAATAHFDHVLLEPLGLHTGVPDRCSRLDVHRGRLLEDLGERIRNVLLAKGTRLLRQIQNLLVNKTYLVFSQFLAPLRS